MRVLFTLLIIILTLYPIAELTRILWTQSIYYHPRLFSTFAFETAFMWTLYLCVIPVLLWRLKKEK